jgi:acetoacetyl-[acyl-carrier protein] synthase
MLEKRHGAAALTAHARTNESVREVARGYDAQSIKGLVKPTYRFGENVKDEDDVTVSASEVRIAGYDKPISLVTENPYLDPE